MTPRMQDALIALSTFHHPDPDEVFRRVLDCVAAEYPGTMAMVTLLEQERMRYRAVANLHPALSHLDSIALTRTY